jgi:hypothetical protein
MRLTSDSKEEAQAHIEGHPQFSIFIYSGILFSEILNCNKSKFCILEF